MFDYVKGLFSVVCAAALLLLLYTTFTFSTKKEQAEWFASWELTKKACSIFENPETLLCPTTVANSLYCPWADSVVKIQFTPDRSKVELAYAIHGRTPILEADRVPHPDMPDTTELHFRELDGRYLYDFYFTENLNILRNTRLEIATGRRFQQQGYCFAEGRA